MHLRSAVAIAAGAALVLLAPGPSAAQARRAPASPAAANPPLSRTADGQPDVQGHWGTDAYTQDLETGLPDEETNTIQGRGPVDTSRFTFIDAKTMKYEVTITDPKVLTRPFTITLPFEKRARPANYELFESACVEGNKDNLGFTIK